jgi:hypothetical protein
MTRLSILAFLDTGTSEPVQPFSHDDRRKWLMRVFVGSLRN